MMNHYTFEENEFLASFSQNVNIDLNTECDSCKCDSGCVRSEIMNLKNKIERIEEKLDVILQKMDNNIIKNCDKMGDHIDFVNNVYDTVKVPLHYISNKVQKMIGGTSVNASNSVEYVKDDQHQYVNHNNDDEYLFTESD